jgi:hypothetical protein
VDKTIVGLRVYKLLRNIDTEIRVHYHNLQTSLALCEHKLHVSYMATTLHDIALVEGRSDTGTRLSSVDA